MKLIALTSFSWAHRNVDVISYQEGEEIETEDEDLITVSQAEGWAKLDGAPSEKTSMTVDQIKEALAERKIDIPDGVTRKADLQKLLDSAE